MRDARYFVAVSERGARNGVCLWMKKTVALIALVLGTRLHAQTPVCFRGQPLPKCDGWLVLEARLMQRVEGSSHPFDVNTNLPLRTRDLREYAAGGIGYMRNVDTTQAVGGIFSVGGSETGVRIALEGRRRTWLNHGLASFDVGGGVLTAQQQDVGHPGTSQAYGVTGHAALGVVDVVGVMLAADLVRGQGHTSHAIHVGVQLDSWGGVAAGLVTIAGAILIGLALSGEQT